MFFLTSIISLMVTFRTFSFLDFLADLLQKSQLPVICLLVVCFVSSFIYILYLFCKPSCSANRLTVPHEHLVVRRPHFKDL
jgi:hypothetical protein